MAVHGCPVKREVTGTGAGHVWGPLWDRTTSAPVNDLRVGTRFTRRLGRGYWLPSEDQWYKAAYYDPTKGGVGGYWEYATRSDALPSYDVLGTDSANYNDQRDKGFKLSVVGTYVNSHSYYGANDMTGNQWEWAMDLCCHRPRLIPGPASPRSLNRIHGSSVAARGARA